jgi:hypothetical protein
VLVAENGHLASRGYFYVGLAGSPPTPTTMVTVPPAATTTVPPAATTTVPPAATTTVSPNSVVQPKTAPNWSGYVMTGSQPYTGVQGTFTVPSLTTSATCDSEAAEWVGIDGFGNTDLIQAGIDESATNEDSGTCAAPNNFYISVWWEIIPALPVTIANWDNGTPATVNVGDQVTVTISEVSDSACSSLPPGDTCWGIEVQDDTTGGTFVTDQPYGGPGSSAEWIVEDPGVVGQGCGVIVNGAAGQCPMPDYTPAVQFTGLSITPSTYANLYSETLVQNGVAVSTPSSLSDNYDFSVSYTGGSQGAPESSGSRLPITSYPLSTPVVVGHSGAGPRPFPTTG